MADLPPPTLRLKLDEAALAGNWRSLDRMSGAARAGAAVKANCYGLGAGRCVPVLSAAGATDFFVAHWSEVGDVLAHVPGESISVLHGPLHDEDAVYAKATGVVPVINSFEQAKRWLDAGGGVCDLMIDTGINRLGIRHEEVGEPILQSLEVRVLMSHLACADEDHDLNRRQLERFRSVIPAIPHKQLSFANSAGIGLGSDYHFDLTRPGLSLYGGIPRAEFDGIIGQVAYPQTAILQVRQLQAGDCVGYNATFTADRAMRVGVISLGYADGILRSWRGADLLDEDRRLPILGKVSMDMIVIDLTQAPELREGDWVELPYSLPDAAQQTSLSQYELLTVLGRRFER